MSISQKYARSVNCLKDDDRTIRLTAINDIFNLYLSIDKQPEEVITELNDFLNEGLLSNILLLVSDQISQIRQKSILLIQSILKNNSLNISQNQMNLIFPVIYSRLNQNNNNFVEQIEEIRLLLLTVMSNIVELSKWNINFFIAEMLQILSKALIDNNPQMKEEISIFCVLLLEKSKQSQSTLEQISISCKGLVISLGRNCSHQRNKVRKLSIASMGKLICISPLCFADVNFVFKKALSDKNSEVRHSCFSALSEILMSFNITYLNKYENIIVMYIMVGLSDETETIRDFCYDELDKIGIYREKLSQSIEETTVDTSNLPDIINPFNKDLTFELKTKNEFNLMNLKKPIDFELNKRVDGNILKMDIDS